jgi:hypothetical protein
MANKFKFTSFMKMLNVPAYLLYIFMMSCATPKSTTTTTQPGKYSEDLSVVRPKVEMPKTDTTITQTDRKQTAYVEPKYTINEQLDGVLDSISSINRTQKYIDGFTIQVYSGSKREEALNIRKQITTSVPELDSEVQYVQPNFRVKAGRYLHRLDAQKDYMTLKQYFPSAIVIPDKISIN